MFGHGVQSAAAVAPQRGEQTSWRARGRRVLLSPCFRHSVTGGIVVNIGVLTVEADQEVDHDEGAETRLWSQFLLAFFVAELSLRLFVDRLEFFTNKHRGWNIFDLTICSMSIFNLWILPTLMTWPLMSNCLFLLRITRIARVLRTFRIIEGQDKMLWVAKGLVRSLESVFWVAIFMLVYMTGYAIFLTKLLGGDPSPFEDNDAKEIVREAFGTYTRSMATLFKWLTFDDWSGTARIVNGRYWWMEYVWISYFVVAQWTFLALVTGLSVEKMNEQRVNHERDRQRNQLLLCFEQSDKDDTHTLTLKEFTDMLSRPDFERMLADCGVELTGDEAPELFGMLDQDHTGTLSFEELKTLLSDLVGTEDCQIHAMCLEGVIRCLDGVLRESCVFQGSVHTRVNELLSRAMRVRERLSSLEPEVSALLEGL